MKHQKLPWANDNIHIFFSPFMLFFSLPCIQLMIIYLWNHYDKEILFTNLVFIHSFIINKNFTYFKTSYYPGSSDLITLLFVCIPEKISFWLGIGCPWVSWIFSFTERIYHIFKIFSNEFFTERKALLF